MERGHLRVRSLIVPVVSALSAAGIVWAATAKFGLGLTPDSVGYLSTARNLLDGDGFVLWNGSLYVDWPPLYPALLAALAALFGVDPLLVTRPLNALLLGASCALSWHLLRRHATARNGFLLLGTLAVVTAPSLVRVTTMVWSEMLFITLSLGCLVALEHYVERPRLDLLLAAGGIAMLACLTRYMGITLVATGGIVLLLRHRDDWPRALERMVVFGATALWAPSLWIARNVALTGTPTGVRSPAERGIGEVLGRVGERIGEWVMASPETALVGLLAASGAILVASARPRRLHGTAPLVVFSVVYVGVLVAAAVRTKFDPIDDRLLSPVHAPLLVLGLALAAETGRRLEGRVPRIAVRRAGALLLAVWLLHPVGLLARHVPEWREVGAGGMNQTAWRSSRILERVRADDRLRGERVYSNAPDVCYALGDLPEVRFSPARRSYRGWDEWDECWPKEPAWLVWFDRFERPYLLAPEELAVRADLEVVHRERDGAVYRVVPRGGGCMLAPMRHSHGERKRGRVRPM